MEEEKDFIITVDEILNYGDDARAIIRAFADKIDLSILEQQGKPSSNKDNLEALVNEIMFILRYEIDK